MAPDDLYDSGRSGTSEEPDEKSEAYLQGEKRLGSLIVDYKGKNVSLKDMTSEEFAHWYGEYFLMRVKEMGCGHEICSRFAMLSLLDEIDIEPEEFYGK